MERSNLRRQSDQFPTGALHGWIKSLQDLRDAEKPLSSGERQLLAQAKRILSSELRWSLDKDEDETNAHLDKLLSDLAEARAEARAARA